MGIVGVGAGASVEDAYAPVVVERDGVRVAFVGFTEALQGAGIDMASWGGEHVGGLAYAGMRMPLQIVPRIEWFDPLMGLVAVLVVSLLASLWPAVAAGRLDPMEAMRSIAGLVSR